jgi:hypothetical protein
LAYFSILYLVLVLLFLFAPSAKALDLTNDQLAALENYGLAAPSQIYSQLEMSLKMQEFSTAKYAQTLSLTKSRSCCSLTYR